MIVLKNHDIMGAPGNQEITVAMACPYSLIKIKNKISYLNDVTNINDNIDDKYIVQLKEAIIKWITIIDEITTDYPEYRNIYYVIIDLYKNMLQAFIIQEGFTSAISAEAFSPKRMQYIIDTYGYEAIDDM